MKSITIRAQDLYVFAGNAAPLHFDKSCVERLAREQFAFLNVPLTIEVQGEDVTISFAEESQRVQEEAARLAARAAKRAGEGAYEKAVAIWKRVVNMQPSLSSARRDLAMALVEMGDSEEAKNQLIDVLRMNPGDVWGLVVLANIYLKADRDFAVAERFLRRALDVSPDDPWALNSLAALQLERGNRDQALELFQNAIRAHPEFANPYYGLALAFANAGNMSNAADTLEGMFRQAKLQDDRSRPVFEQARALFVSVEMAEAERNHSESFKVVETMKNDLVLESGFPIRVEAEERTDGIGAVIRMAWKHGTDHHLVSFRKSFPPPIVTHLVAHELQHLRYECAARKRGRNLFFTTTAKTREMAIRTMETDIARWQKRGHSEQSITSTVMSLLEGTCRFLFNCPIDMLIERDLRQKFRAQLGAAQFVSLHTMVGEAAKANTTDEVRKLTPRHILSATLALNGAYAIFLDQLFDGATDYWSVYRKCEGRDQAVRLHEHWRARSDRLTPGDEYELVDDFAEMLGLRSWYEWKPDPGTHTVKTGSDPQGTTNPSLLKEKHPAAVWYLLDALKRFSAMAAEQVREITFEIGVLGQQGLDYSSPERKYSLRSLPGETFSGLQLMCLMHVGFHQIDPTADTGMDLRDPFLQALELFQREKQ